MLACTAPNVRGLAVTSLQRRTGAWHASVVVYRHPVIVAHAVAATSPEQAEAPATTATLADEPSHVLDLAAGVREAAAREKHSSTIRRRRAAGPAHASDATADVAEHHATAAPIASKRRTAPRKRVARAAAGSDGVLPEAGIAAVPAQDGQQGAAGSVPRVRSQGRTARQTSGTDANTVPGKRAGAAKAPAKGSNRKGTVRSAGAGAVIAASAAVAVAASAQSQKGDTPSTNAPDQNPAADADQGALPKVELTPEGAALAASRVAPSRAQDNAAFIARIRERAAALESAPLTQLADHLSASLAAPTAGAGGAPAAGTLPTVPGVDQGSHADGEGAAEGEAHGESDVYRSEVEVVSEVVEGLLAVKLPLKAYYGARAAVLARMSVEECKAQARVWLQVCGPVYARLFIGREPRLLAMAPAQLLQSLEAISTQLALPAPDAVEWALRNTSLITAGLSQERLSASVQEVCDVLGVDRTRGAAVARRASMLLTYPAGTLQARAAVLREVLPVDERRLATVLAREPRLITKSPASVGTHLSRLSEVTGLSLSDAALMLAGHPGLLGLAADRVQHRWHRLCNLAASYEPWRQQVASMPPARLGRCLAAPETSLNRLAFVVNKQLTGSAAVQDLKVVLTSSSNKFKAALLSENRFKGKVAARQRAAQAL